MLRLVMFGNNANRAVCPFLSETALEKNNFAMNT